MSNNAMLKVSVIIPNYNHALYLKERIDSVLNQTYKDMEIIILDDCSTDHSKEIIETYVDHPLVSHVIYNEVNSGSTFKQWKKGLKVAKGDWIWIAESDDVSEDTFLEKLIGKIGGGEKSVVYCQSYDVDHNNEVIADRISYTANFQPNIWERDFVMDGRNFVQKYMVEKNVIPNTSAVLFYNYRDWENLLDSSLTKMKMCGDWLFWSKLALDSKVFFVAEKLNRFRSHDYTTRVHNSISKQRLRLWEERDVRFFFKKQGFVQRTQEVKLYKKWFSLHPLWSEKFAIRISTFTFFKFCISRIKNMIK